MLKIKNIHLKNYAGYRDCFFDFQRSDKSFVPISAFFGPNGCGKSNCLHAIRIASSAQSLHGRDNSLFFRKMIFHPDYDPSLPHFASYKEEMKIDATYDEDGEEKKVIISSENGIEKNELTSFHNSIFIDADHPINMKKFYVDSKYEDLFVDIAETVYGFNVSLEKGVVTYEKDMQFTGSAEKNNEIWESFNNEEVGGEKYSTYQDLIITKEDVRVHFKSMSDGERKIATLLRNLCDPSIIEKYDIILIDNIEMHVYMQRHARMIDKILESFPNKQFLVTTHSPILVGVDDPVSNIFVQSHIANKWGEDCLFDISKLKTTDEARKSNL